MADEQPPRALSANRDDPTYDPEWAPRLAVFINGERVKCPVAYDMGDLGGNGWVRRMKTNPDGGLILDAQRNVIYEQAWGVVTVEIVEPQISDI